MNKTLIPTIFTLSLLFLTKLSPAQNISVKSPDGKLKLAVELSDKIYYTFAHENEQLLARSVLGLQLKGQTLGEEPKLKKQKITSLKNVLAPVVPLKFSKISNEYNLLSMEFSGDYAVEFRVYNEGVAYRFITGKKGQVEILNENLFLQFPSSYLLHVQQTGGFGTAYEEPYSAIVSNIWKTENHMSTLPVLIDTRKKYKILISESDLEDYPAMFIKGNGQNGVSATFPKAPLAFGENGDRSQKILKEADYIAKTAGTRSFPWRYFVVTENDGQLLTNTMTGKLAAASTIKDPSWIQPGQVSWEWWNDAAPYGPDVNFVSGYNLETYKYYIDFAAKNGIKYIIMDEGWAKDTTNPFEPNPDVDLKALLSYGQQKKVGIILWLTWLTVEKNFHLFKTFSEWGVKGVKIDFMDRSDQWMVNYYERVAKEAARYKLFVDFHGSFKPAGLEYKYPNVLSYEGVRGMEQMAGAIPDNSVFLPFIRNAVGAMDYTPGAMLSMQPEVYGAQRPNAASIGTRSYQMALFVIFESGLQMLADNPTMYYRNQDCTDFITQVPTTWDETRALAAKAGEYAIVAKRKGDRWFIGGMTNNMGEREFELKFDFLKTGETFKVTSFEDGINAGRQAMDYRRREFNVRSGESIRIKMVRNGGWAAVVQP
ncbi:glycoside hydrolase family 97 protein [Pedobacter nyackensis]|uniref:glycoside hydrolase family 97 protein n=1 Tax=Pedobacter nyackensis TaxID=475255 RepID=UPI002931371B|nr:glycoside hydrolase family 97 protein [Pedobacter nyackensis]